MDPFSITVGVVGLVATSSKIVTSLKTFADLAHGVSGRVQLMISEVEMLERVLQSMNRSLHADSLQSFFQSTGHLAEHWTNISVCLLDGQKMMSDLEYTLDKVNKSARVLDSARKAMRLKSAWEDISAFHQRCRSCRENIQLSLQAALLWGQVSSRNPAQINAPNLAELIQSIQRLASAVSLRMVSLEGGRDSDATIVDELDNLKNIKLCVQSAANVVSSATSLSTGDRESVAAASDLHRIFRHKPSQHTMAWIAETSRADPRAFADEPPPRLRRPSSIPTISVSMAADYESDSDGEMEAEIATLQVSKARDAMQSGNLTSAERLLSKGLDRVRKSRSRHMKASIQVDALRELAALYQQQGKWQDAKNAIVEKLAVLSRTATADSTDILQEKLTLAEVLLQLHDSVQARLQVRTCIKAYRKLGAEGRGGLERSLQLMIDACNHDNDLDGEEEYRMLLANVEMPVSLRATAMPPQAHQHDPGIPTRPTQPQDHVPEARNAAETQTHYHDSVSQRSPKPPTSIWSLDWHPPPSENLAALPAHGGNDTGHLSTRAGGTLSTAISGFPTPGSKKAQ